MSSPDRSVCQLERPGGENTLLSFAIRSSQTTDPEPSQTLTLKLVRYRKRSFTRSDLLAMRTTILSRAASPSQEISRSLGAPFFATNPCLPVPRLPPKLGSNAATITAPRANVRFLQTFIFR